MRRHSTLVPLLLTLALGACGTRGPLFLPPVQNKPASAAPAVPAAQPSAPDDLNTPPDPAP